MVKIEVTLDKTTTNNKGNRLDLLAEIDNKEQINVEIQTSNKYNIVNRSLYYRVLLYTTSQIYRECKIDKIMKITKKKL